MEIRKAELGELQALMRAELSGLYPGGEIKGIVRGLFMHLTGLSPSQLVLENGRRLSASELFFLQQALRRLKRHEPLQYITGKAWFYGDQYHVDPSVLIPRPETEELVGWVLHDHPGMQRPLRILDVGTGSGCIAITLKKHLPVAAVHAIDISDAALKIAMENALALGAEIDFKCLDILDAEACKVLDTYDIIVSNPPYVTPADRERMLPNVSGHEPAIALFVDEDPLLFYRHIVDLSSGHMGEGGRLYFECNEAYATAVAELLQENGYSGVEIRNDMQGKERMVRGSRRL